LTIARIARTSFTVLVEGESGVGKELVAREVHARSPRRRGPFVAVNCAALVESLVEAELFGI
jgi:transcriptional regulator with PAS, ATPase and Fis domain